jgi:hypothetical protein
LSLAIQDVFGQKGVDICTREKDLETVDVGCDEGFAKLLRTRATWLHGAPPCKTFSRARRTDQFASVKCLRTLERPQGFGSEAADVANKLALRMLEMAKGQMERGDYFSIENPFSSLMWRLKPYERLAGEENVRMVRLHQCMVGSMHKKETGVLTNAPWIVDVLCDEADRPHHHVPLMGIVEDYREPNAKKVFYTELAAEYPEGLCSMWAASFHEYSKQAEGEHAKRAHGSGEKEWSAVSRSEDSQVDTSGSTAMCGGAVGHSRVQLKDSVEPPTGARAQDDGPVMATELQRGVRPVMATELQGEARPVMATELQRGVPILAQKATNW